MHSMIKRNILWSVVVIISAMPHQFFYTNKASITMCRKQTLLNRSKSSSAHWHLLTIHKPSQQHLFPIICLCQPRNSWLLCFRGQPRNSWLLCFHGQPRNSWLLCFHGQPRNSWLLCFLGQHRNSWLLCFPGQPRNSWLLAFMRCKFWL